jgi:hypothetical protein
VRSELIERRELVVRVGVEGYSSCTLSLSAEVEGLDIRAGVEDCSSSSPSSSSLSSSSSSSLSSSSLLAEVEGLVVRVGGVRGASVFRKTI